MTSFEPRPQRAGVPIAATGNDVSFSLQATGARVRIQVLTHEPTPEQVTRLEDELAEKLGGKGVDRSRPDTEVHEDGQDKEKEERDAERERVAARGQAEPAPPEPRRPEPRAEPPAPPAPPAKA